MLYLDKYSNRRLMKGREHPHLLLSTITENLFVYAQAFEFFFFKFAARNAGFLREVTVNLSDRTGVTTTNHNPQPIHIIVMIRVLIPDSIAREYIP